MATTHVLPTRIAEAEPYKGDDWAQSMSRWMATPMFLMGAMAVALSLALGIVGGVNIGDFFGNLANPDLDDLGRAQAAAIWLPGLRLLGIATLLTSIVLVLLTIQKVLRFQAARISELATPGPIPVGSVPTQPSTGRGVPADQPAAWRTQLQERLGRSA